MNTRTLSRAAITLGVLGALCMVLLTLMIFRLPAHGADIPPLALACAIAGGACLLGMMSFVALYVYYDAESRGMKGGLWALLIFLFASLPGFLIYLLMRTPKLRSCPVCRTALQSDFVVCPTCQTRVGQGCPGCHRHVEPGWVTCPRCQCDLLPGKRRSC